MRQPSLIIDTVPEDRRSPKLSARALVVEAARPQLEALIKDEVCNGAKMSELAISMIEAPDGWLTITTTRAELKKKLEEHFPNPRGEYKGFDGVPEGFVTVVVIGRDGGVTVTAMGYFEMPDKSKN